MPEGDMDNCKAGIFDIIENFAKDNFLGKTAVFVSEMILSGKFV